ncbi:MAG: hypothetical protein QM784_35660 [Polyangiaceae bacterium]
MPWIALEQTIEEIRQNGRLRVRQAMLVPKRASLVTSDAVRLLTCRQHPADSNPRRISVRVRRATRETKLELVEQSLAIDHRARAHHGGSAKGSIIVRRQGASMV